jgi:hypothetical protein
MLPVRHEARHLAQGGHGDAAAGILERGRMTPRGVSPRF